MRQHQMSDSAALRLIYPKRRKDKRALVLLGALIILMSALVAGIYYNNHRQQMIREQEWMNAVATIEDARPHLAMQVESMRGGGMLYEVEILTKYVADGVVQERWTKLRQAPRLLADAQLQAYLLKNRQCVVRWRPSDTGTIVAEIE